MLKTNDKELIEFVKERYFKRFPNHTLKQFKNDYAQWELMPVFKACENYYEINTDYSDRYKLADIEGKDVVPKIPDLTPEVHWIMRMSTQYFLTKAFEAMKIDLDDPNLKEEVVGKGTPGRVAKIWTGNDPTDTTELLSGRYNKEPYIATFPNEGKSEIITKEVDLTAVCSHHFLPFTSLEGGKCIIKYKPDKFILGISKLGRWVHWAATRAWLQEDLTKYIGKGLCRITGTKDVYVRLENIQHSCERYRGAHQYQGNLTTEFKSGIFEENPDLCR